MADGFLLPLPNDKYLAFVPLSGMAAMIDTQAAAELANTAAHTTAIADLLTELGCTLQPPPARPSGNIAPHFLGLTTTRGCNIGCVYCNFGGPEANNTVMPAQTAMTAIDWMAQQLLTEKRRLFRLHFFGGEPLVAWDLIELAVHKVRYVCAQHGLDHYIDASTNGILSERKARFVGDYFGGVVLSFDGPRQFQNRNRPTKSGGSTFEQVERTALLWRDMPLDLCLRVCVTEDSVDQLAEITQWMCERFDPTVINFETLTPGELAASAGLKVPQPREFARACIQAFRTADDLGVRAVYSAAEYQSPRRSFCPVGSDSPIVNPDGSVNACYLLAEDWQQRGLDMQMGEVKNEKIVIYDEILQQVRDIPATKTRCQQCLCKWSCAGGCHVNQTYPGSPTSFTDFCEQTRIITAALILEELGQGDMVDALLADELAMQRLAASVQTFSVGAETTLPQAGAYTDRQPLNTMYGILQ